MDLVGGGQGVPVVAGTVRGHWGTLSRLPITVVGEEVVNVSEIGVSERVPSERHLMRHSESKKTK